MSEITRVPLQPVAPGSVGKIWLGALVAVALGGALAYGTRARGLEVDTIKAGTGASPTAGDYVLVNYVGHLSNGHLEIGIGRSISLNEVAYYGIEQDAIRHRPGP